MVATGGTRGDGGAHVSRSPADGPTSLLVLLLVLAGCGGAAAGPATAGGPAAGRPATPASDRSAAIRSSVDRLLEHSSIASIVSDRAGPFTRQVAIMIGDPTDAELERLVPAVRSAFAPETMRGDVAAFLVREAPGDGTVQDLLAWRDRGATAELEGIAEAYEPPLTVSEYARSLLAAPPDPERVERIADWVEGQRAGEFYVLMEEALAEAAHAVWAELRPDAPEFTPLRGAELQRRLADSFNASVVQFLHRYETVPDSVLEAAHAEYESAAGRWYVETYSLAVAEAIRAAGQRAVQNLRERSGGARQAPPSSRSR